ncbi:MAG: methionine--tRNA ligase [Candidatus Calescibacterium sp.]|nr:methionine--tRNA ligase [Candidatus Calescibacterium sp.]MCX7971810.1 methionine--tRNA ligase [bacterium]MDW8194924.1 methionine--tRNA ligase [Candidatus Calescibacterium sp.]
MSKIYITTPIYYPNADPHVGTAYTTCIADFLSRYYQQRNFDVFFMTGNDENSIKVHETAQKLKKDTQKYTDEMADIFKQIWQKLEIQYTKFIRTTDKEHINTVEYVFNKLYQEGHIYKSYYEGWYCRNCETFWTKSKIGDNKLCPNIECQRPLELIKEDNYFLRLSNFQEKLLKFYEENPEVIFPPTRYNEVISFIKMGLQDISVSRKSVEWGIKIPFDKDYVIYVWLDALLNYISGIGYPNKFMHDYWKNVHHIMGKDIIRFHAIIWPSILMALNLDLPRKLIVHGWLTTPDNQKISKSKGGDIFNLKDFVMNSPPHLIMALRYYLIREGSFGEDVPVSLERFRHIYTSELANNIGNLISRVLALVQKNLENTVQKKSDFKFIHNVIDKTTKDFDNHIQKFELSKGIESILELANFLNKSIEENRPWELAKNKEQLNNLMFEMVYGVLFLAKLLYPIIPYTSRKIIDQLGIESLDFNPIDLERVEVRYREPLFPALGSKFTG